MCVPDTPQRRLRIFRALALLFFPFLFLSAEIALRIRESMKPRPLVTGVWHDKDPWLGYRLRKDGMTPDGMAYINAEGLRGDDTHVSTATGEPRVLLLGNSCVYGAGSRDTEIFAVALEKRLRETGFESAIVFNAGVGGYNSNQCRVYLDRELWRYEPDHIIVYMGWNDLVTSTWPYYLPNYPLGRELYKPPSGFWSTLLGVMDKSKVCWHARAWIEGWSIRRLRSDGGVDIWNEDWIRNFRGNLDTIVAEAGKRGALVHLCLLPYDHGRFPKSYANNAFHYTSEGYRRLWSRFQDEIRGAAAASGLPVVDLPKAIADVEHDTAVIIDYNHLGPEGHKLVAEAMLESIMKAESGGQGGQE